MRRYERKIRYVASVLLVLLVMLSGCGGSGDSGDSGKDWWQKIKALYNSKVTDSSSPAKVYVEGIRGYAGYFADLNGEVSFTYHSNDHSEITLCLDRTKKTGHFDLYVYEDKDNSFYTRGDDTKFSELSSYIDDLISGKKNYDPYKETAMINDPELVISDLKILYARFLALWNREFSEFDVAFKNVGIDLGSNYENIDVTQPTSKEIVITNEHHFENGICTDCGETWTKYMNQTLAMFCGKEVKEIDGKTDWFSCYGQESPYCGYYVQYSSDSTTETELFLMDDNDPVLSCRIRVWQNEDNSLGINIIFGLDEGPYSAGQGIVADKYRFSTQTSAGAGEFAEIFSSKEAYKERSVTWLLSPDENRVIQFLWDEYSDEENEKAFKKDQCQYYSEEEFIDYIWEQHERMLRAIDEGMIWYDTSLKDLGVNYR